MAPYGDGPLKGRGRDWAHETGQGGEGSGGKSEGPRGEVGEVREVGARGPMGERGGASIMRRGGCKSRGPLGVPDGDVDLGGGI